MGDSDLLVAMREVDAMYTHTLPITPGAKLDAFEAGRLPGKLVMGPLDRQLPWWRRLWGSCFGERVGIVR